MNNYCGTQEIIEDPTAVLKEEFAKMSTYELVQELMSFESTMDIYTGSQYDGIVVICDIIHSELATRRVTIQEVN